MSGYIQSGRIQLDVLRLDFHVDVGHRLVLEESNRQNQRLKRSDIYFFQRRNNVRTLSSSKLEKSSSCIFCFSSCIPAIMSGALTIVEIKVNKGDLYARIPERQDDDMRPPFRDLISTQHMNIP